MIALSVDHTRVTTTKLKSSQESVTVTLNPVWKTTHTRTHDEEENSSSIYNQRCDHCRSTQRLHNTQHERVSSFLLEGNIYHQSKGPTSRTEAGRAHCDKFALI